MTCFFTHNVSGPCSACGVFSHGVHIVGEKLYCAACCVVCRQANHLWGEGVGPVGEQAGFDF